MEITAEDAVNHIANSLSNTNADYWWDETEGVTWVVRGRGDEIEIFFMDENDEDIGGTTFRLVVN